MASLKAQLKAALNRVDKEIKGKIKEAAEEIGKALVEQSTVDTGLFAANWKVGIDHERKDDFTHADFGVSGARGGRQISESIAKDIATDIPEFELGQDIIFSNSVPHLDQHPLSSFDPFSDAVAGAKIGRDRAKQKVGK